MHTGRTDHSSTQQGFTLLEVMVALMVVAVALAGLSQGLGQFLSQQTALEQRVVASWAAQNRLAAIQPLPGQKMPSLEMSQDFLLQQTWWTRITPLGSAVPGFTQIQITAYAAQAGGQALGDATVAPHASAQLMSLMPTQSQPQ